MRLPELSYEDLTPRQREAWDKHAERRTVVRGPYGVWLHSPELMDKVSSVSNYMRFDCALPEKLREFGILVTARYWDAQYSWNAHVDKARAAGVADDVIDDLAAGRKPHFVSDATFAEARALFGEQGTVDLIGSVGYFSMLQICLNSAQVDLQADRKPPFPDVRGYKKIV